MCARSHTLYINKSAQIRHNSPPLKNYKLQTLPHIPRKVPLSYFSQHFMAQVGVFSRKNYETRLGDLQEKGGAERAETMSPSFHFTLHSQFFYYYHFSPHTLCEHTHTIVYISMFRSTDFSGILHV
jgi:hypothetical protein